MVATHRNLDEMVQKGLAGTRAFVSDLYANVKAGAAQGKDLRDITQELYVADRTKRLQQELVLGIGGVQALEQLGIEPKVYHINEGHSAFLILVRLQRLMRGAGLAAEVMTEYELWLALRSGYVGNEIIANGPCKTVRFLAACIDARVKAIIVDSLPELQRILALAEAGGAAGSVEGAILVSNDSSTRCTLTGYPSFTLLGSDLTPVRGPNGIEVGSVAAVRLSGAIFASILAVSLR